jgi:mitochondrial fission protein ELM1
MPTPSRLCWVVADGRRGVENQALGLAEAVGRIIPLEIEVRRAPRAETLKGRMSSALRAPRIDDLLLPFGAEPEPPVRRGTPPRAPDLWICCGRASLPYAERARAWTSGRAFVVQVQDPKRPLHTFDLVVPPLHDRLEGPNVFPILGSPNRVSAARLAAGAAAFAARAAAIPSPRAAFLIGGDSKRHRLGENSLATIERAMRAAHAAGWGLLITLSRRTPAAAAEALRAAWTDKPGVWFWGSAEDGENPYDAFLAAADLALVTKDSTNMITEAATAGKPVLLLEMEGDDGKFAALYEALAKRGNLRAFDERFLPWRVEPLAETDRVAVEIVRRLEARSGAVRSPGSREPGVGGAAAS